MKEGELQTLEAFVVRKFFVEWRIRNNRPQRIAAQKAQKRVPNPPSFVTFALFVVGYSRWLDRLVSLQPQNFHLTTAK
jgi:hypothetical protein